MAWLFDATSLAALMTLTLLEIVLGIDNIIFLTILIDKLPKHQQELARKLGLFFAMITRILFLLSLTWIMRLSEPLFFVGELGISGRDLVLIIGGGFLIAKGSHEIYGLFSHLEQRVTAPQSILSTASFFTTLVQIALIDIVFSIDSIVTAVGLSNQLPVMITAIIISVVIMMWCAEAIGRFIESNPSIKMLALCFLVIIGGMLVADGIDYHIAKGYVYFALGFSVIVEILNIRLRKLSLALKAPDTN